MVFKVMKGYLERAALPLDQQRQRNEAGSHQTTLPLHPAARCTIQALSAASAGFSEFRVNNSKARIVTGIAKLG